MYYVVMPARDIRDNLATEQYLMNNKDFDEPLVLFYIENPCIIVGRNQNTLEEINAEYVREHHITVTRRLSGGGAVYQDANNVCFSFVVDADDEEFGDFKKMTQPIVDALKHLGAKDVEVSGRNDILVDGKKFSGNAMYTQNGKTFCHGTLSYDVDLDVLTKALNVPADKIKSKGIKSVRSRVTNIRPYLDEQYQNLTTEQFRDTLLLSLFEADDLEQIKDHEYQLTDEDQEQIDQIKQETYANWDWVYGKSPQFTVQKRQHFTSGTIDARLQITNGKIAAIKFYGDFFGVQPVADLETQLIGLDYEFATLQEYLADIDIGQFFAGITAGELAKLLCD
ncbi:lipoate--protein ligase [Bombilactobacillus thymidiniphilus]|uniref:lipoate--protein ligase n=1 Tax=Bombilactobacillus thymidiniphilus TaxID=2923363 RepID=A0ABY4PEH7_9LACO|nr:lipoate--protein ligase [Bombilactobacillus thymidiniphilus]UQS84198.1 lipoate--protein ligase [Bombilactobacillus thymidiniphilus]